MKVVIWDHRRSGKHQHMGEFETTVQGLLNAREPVPQGSDVISFTVSKQDNGKPIGRCEVMKAAILGGNNNNNNNNQSRKSSSSSTSPKKNSTRNSSAAQVTDRMSSASISSPVAAPTNVPQPRPAFIDYLTGGCQISLAVAIDFTASNGDPRVPGTPHYFHNTGDKQWNDYEKAIFAVGSILAKYDSDNKFPVWGFGAKYNDKVRHCFQCGTEVEVEGVQGIMDAYRGVFRTPLRMSFPTRFTEVINTAAGYAQHEQVRRFSIIFLYYMIFMFMCL